MRVERFQVHAFGRLRGLASGTAPLPGLVVVVGPNEAGKSTLFHFLTSMLYGFYPASRDGNPYAPWQGGDPSGTVTLRLDAGSCVDVERRLLSQPTGRMQADGVPEDLRNRTVPWAEHVPRTVFRQVFAVTLEEMAGLDGETWARVQDRILGSMGSTDLRPARHVAAELEQEANRIWRPNRLGNQRARVVEAEIRRLRGTRREAVERDRTLRRLVAEVEGVRRDLQETREARQAALLAVERVQDLQPVRAQLARIAELRAVAGPPEALEGLPADPSGALATLQTRVKQIETRREELAMERAEPEAALAALGATEERLLDHAGEVAAFVAATASLLADRERLATLEQELRDLRRRVDDAAAHVLATPLTPDVEREVIGLSLAELRERIRRLLAVQEEERRRTDTTPPPTAPAPPPLPAVVAVLAAGAVALALGVLSGGMASTLAGAVVMGVGVVLLLPHLRGAGARATLPAPDAPPAGKARAAGALDEVRRVLTPLPVLPSFLAHPTDTVASGLQRVQELLRDREERSQLADEVRRRLAGADDTASRLAATLAVGTGLDAVALGHLLERELRAAERAAERAAAARRELARLDREDERARATLADARAALDHLGERLTDAGHGDREQGIREVRERIRSRDRAAQLQDELERAHPDLEDLRERIRQEESAGAPWTADEGDLARRKAAAEELTQRIEELATRAESLDKDIAQLRASLAVDDIDGQIAALEEEERTLLAERDRRWVMAHLLREADRRFREEHQPDVLRRAGEHLASLTGGRYDRLVVEDASGDGTFQLLGPGLPGPVPLSPPISTGTLEQAYLALRLAIVDHLDQGLERLPLFVDEVFVNWDKDRRWRGMDLLGGLSRHRQIFVFTCHAEIAADLRERGALVLDLAPSR